jgi:hypothetical protein
MPVLGKLEIDVWQLAFLVVSIAAIYVPFAVQRMRATRRLSEDTGDLKEGVAELRRWVLPQGPQSVFGKDESFPSEVRKQFHDLRDELNTRFGNIALEVTDVRNEARKAAGDAAVALQKVEAIDVRVTELERAGWTGPDRRG